MVWDSSLPGLVFFVLFTIVHHCVFFRFLTTLACCSSCCPCCVMSTNCTHGKWEAAKDVGVGDVDLIVCARAFAEEAVATHAAVSVSAADFLSGSKRTVVWPVGQASTHTDALVAFSSTCALVPLTVPPSLATFAEGAGVEEDAAATLDNLDLRRARSLSWAFAICSSFHCRANALHAF